MIANEFPIARLETLSLQALQKKDPDEVTKLMSAASTVGVFYVNLADTPLGKDVLALLPTVYQASEEYFAQPQSVKEKDIRLDQRPDQDKGYKWCETDETYEMPSDEFRDKTIQLPSILSSKASQLKDFSSLSQQVGTQVMEALSDGLGLEGKDRLEHMVNDSTRTSDTALKLVSEPTIDRVSDVGDNTHHDQGLLSMVWCNEWGFKIKDNEDDFGRFARPTEDNVIIHVAKTFEKQTKNRLQSTMHQVTQPLDGAAPRHFIAYNLRPYLT